MVGTPLIAIGRSALPAAFRPRQPQFATPLERPYIPGRDRRPHPPPPPARHAQPLRPPQAALVRRAPGQHGAHAIALTPEGRLILVRLRYAAGWRAPGGGIAPGEDPQAAALRELREEIGLLRHGAVTPGFRSDERIAYRNDSSQIFIVRDVEYAPRWSWEIEAVTEAPLDRLPPGTSPRTLRWLQRARPIIESEATPR